MRQLNHSSTCPWSCRLRHIKFEVPLCWSVIVQIYFCWSLTLGLYLSALATNTSGDICLDIRTCLLTEKCKPWKCPPGPSPTHWPVSRPDSTKVADPTTCSDSGLQSIAEVAWLIIVARKGNCPSFNVFVDVNLNVSSHTDGTWTP